MEPSDTDSRLASRDAALGWTPGIHLVGVTQGYRQQVGVLGYSNRLDSRDTDRRLASRDAAVGGLQGYRQQIGFQGYIQKAGL